VSIYEMCRAIGHPIDLLGNKIKVKIKLDKELMTLYNSS
jgi:hypothetical protein